MIELLIGAILISAAVARGQEETSFTFRSFPPLPDIPLDSHLTENLTAYNSIPAAGLSGWASDQEAFVAARLETYLQLYRVSGPGRPLQALTHFSSPVRRAIFQPDSARYFAYLQDEGGDEVYQLKLFRLSDGQKTVLSLPGCRVPYFVWSPTGKELAWVQNCNGRGEWEIVVGDLSGTQRIVLQRKGTWFPLDWKPGSEELLFLRYFSATKSRLYHYDLKTGRLTPLFPNQSEAFRAAYFATPSAPKRENGASEIHFISDRDGSFSRLYSYQFSGGPLSGSPVCLTCAHPWNVEWATQDSVSQRVLFSLNQSGFSRLYQMSRGFPPQKVPFPYEGVIGGAQFQPGGLEVGLTLRSPTIPGDMVTLSLRDSTVRRWTHLNRESDLSQGFHRPQLVEFPTFDSTEGESRRLEALLYLPGSPDTRLTRPVATVIQLHGGPESQARPVFNPFVQHLVGFHQLAVLIPNVRGSSGYGREFLQLDDGVLREDAVRDIGSLLHWVQSRDDLDSRRVLTMGRSYGGYLSLSAAMHYGPSLRGAISTVGIADFESFLKNTSEYRRDLRRAEYGDERDPAMQRFFSWISPSRQVHRVKIPVLFCHGEKDPRVPVSESEVMHQKLVAAGTKTWFLSFANEGHTFREKENRLIHWTIQSRFITDRLLDGEPVVE